MQIKRCLLSVPAIVAWLTSASQMVVTVVPGGLENAVRGSDLPTELVVHGSIDIRDIEFIRDDMRALQSLDLGDATVAAYNGPEATFLGRTSSPANTWPECALTGHNLRTIILPHNIEEIADGAFGGCGIEAIEIPTGVKVIGTSAFAGCSSLKSIVVPVAVSSLGTGVFKDCTSLAKVVIQSPLRQLPEATFMGCSNLSEVQLPSSIAVIGNDAFNSCAALESIAFPASLTSVGDRAFYGTSISEADMEGCTELKTLGQWAFAGCRQLTTVKFSDILSVIGTGAFFNDEALALGAPLPSTLSHIGDFSLRGISDTAGNLMAGTSVDSVGAYALANWRNVQKLVLPGTLEYLGDGAMANWTALEQIDAATATNVPTLGAGVWRGIDQETVSLVVPLHLAEDFRNAEQWDKFDIKSTDVSSDKTVEDTAANVQVSARFEGLTLVLESPVDIADVFFFDVQGRNYRFPVHGGESRVRVDTSAWDNAVMIACVMLTDGTCAVFKLSR